MLYVWKLKELSKQFKGFQLYFIQFYSFKENKFPWKLLSHSSVSNQTDTCFENSTI